MSEPVASFSASMTPPIAPSNSPIASSIAWRRAEVAARTRCKIECRGGGEIEEDRLRQHVDRSANFAGRKRYLRLQHGDPDPQHRRRRVHPRTAFEAERGLLLDRWPAAALQICRAELGLQQLLELRDLDAAELAAVLLIDFGHLRKPRRAGDHLVDRLADDAVRALARVRAASPGRDHRWCSSPAGRPVPERLAAAPSRKPFIDRKVPRYKAAMVVRALMARLANTA